MHRVLRGITLGGALLAAASCADGSLRSPTAIPDPSLSVRAAASPASPRITEIHYDNAGTDAGEAIEVTAPAGTDLSGWTLVLYNGSNGTPYSTTSLAGDVASCGEEVIRVVAYPANGIQNGDPDGIALVDAVGAVVEFLSYEGTLTAVGGPADGMTSTDIGVRETSSTPVGHSVKRNALGGWEAPSPSSFGVCEGSGPPEPGPTTVVINELMTDPLAALSASWGEWFEVHNHGDEPVNLGGWTVASGGQPSHVVNREVIVPAGGYVVLGRSDNESNNGGAGVDYNYFTGNSTTIWLDDSDWLVLRSPAGATVDSVAWNGLATGATRALRDAAVDDANASGANWGYSTTTFGGGDHGTPGAANGTLSDVAPPLPTGVVRITISGRDASDPPLPVGFEDQLFASAFDAQREPVATTFTWSSATPELATVDADGVVRALGAGTAIIRATSEDGRVGTFTLTTTVATLGTTADYEGNTEFGVPTDADPSDDFIIERPTYTVSYSSARNTPNWVSYDLEASHFGAQDRCDCFTGDPALPAGYARLTTADYTGAGAYAGYGIDRGHLVRSFDRTAGNLDNAYTYYLSNIIPQTADMNQGPWAVLEDSLGKLAQSGRHEVYIVTGVAGEQGTVKGEGKIVIPESVWKVAVIMPRDAGVESVDSPDDVQLIVVDMPNVPGIRNTAWQSYATTVDVIEARTGYDLLALLPDHIEWLVEAGIDTPEAPAGRLLAVLMGSVEEMMADGGIAAGNGQSLLAKLSAAQHQVERGNANGARGPLGAFVNEVAAMVRSGRLPAADGAALANFAEWVIDATR
ncbi:MAG TPA: DNA/RNA non-specific endonuclease [Gemmatimonadales bacterium]